MAPRNDTFHTRKEVADVKLENIELVYQTCERPMLLTDFHYHSAVEIIYALDGVSIVMIGETSYTLKPGEMIVINADDSHAVFIADYGIHQTFAIKFIPETICSATQSLLELHYIIPYILTSPDFKHHYTKDEVESTHIKQIIEEIMQTDRDRELAYLFSIRILVSQLILNLIRFNKLTLSEDEIDNELRERISGVFKYIAVHYAENITVTELAKKFHIRQMDFSACFKKMTGKTFNEYLVYIRICKAKMLLLNSTMSIAQISEEVGFSYTNYFIKCFKKQMGVTPLNFKQMYSDLPTSVYIVP